MSALLYDFGDGDYISNTLCRVVDFVVMGAGIGQAVAATVFISECNGGIRI